MQTIDQRHTLENGQRVQLYRKVRDWSKDGAPFEHKPYKKAYYLKSYDGFQLRKNARRYMFPSNFDGFDVVDVPKQQGWASAWGRVARAMRKTGVNTSSAQLIEDNLKLGEDAIKDLAARYASYSESAYWGTAETEAMNYEQQNEYRDRLLAEWVEMYKHIVPTLDAETCHKHLTLGTQNYPMTGLPRIVTMNVRREYVEHALERVKSGAEEKARAENWQSPSRDYSVSISKHTSGDDMLFKNGEVRAYYASEYKNCGNGAYYMMMTPTQAWHMEND